MGGSSSKAITEIVNESITNSVFTASNKCLTTMSSEQLISIVGNNNIVRNVDFSLTATLKQDCGQNIELITKIQNSIASAIVATAEASGTGITSALGASSSEIDTRVRNVVQNNLTTEVLNEIVLNTNDMQKIIIQGSNNIIDGASFKTLRDTFSSASQTVAQKIATELTTSTDSTSKAEAKTAGIFDFAVDALRVATSGVVGSYLITAIVAIVVVIAGAFISSKVLEDPSLTAGLANAAGVQYQQPQGQQMQGPPPGMYGM